MIMQLKSLYERNEFYQALEIVNTEINHLKSLRYSEFKRELEKIGSAEEFQVLIRLTDHFLMYHYSSFIARYAYRHFPNFLTVSWYCEELLDDGKLLEADELISAAIAENHEDLCESEVVERLYFCKIRCLLEMKRYKEAELLLEKVKQSPRPIFDKLGYVAMQLGNREKAEFYFTQGLEMQEKGRICYLLLADIKAANGFIEEALSIIETGAQQYPQTPAFQLEKIRRFRDLGKMTEMLEEIKNLNDNIPEHSFHNYFRHLTRMAKYRLGDFDKLESFYNKENIKKSLFKKINEHGKLTKLGIKPIIQKSNYCVPASLEMILTYYGVTITQDEIAQHIFDTTGSKLSTTVEYIEKLGYTCRYFIGNKEHYQTLLEKGIPILLSVDFEHSSHVQVMIGYDSRFDFYHVQDPNLHETMYISRSDLEKANMVTNHMSIVCVPKDRSEELSFLSVEEDNYFRTLHDLGEKMEVDEAGYKEVFLKFLMDHFDVPYTAIYVVKHFSFEEYHEFIMKCAEKLLMDYPNNDFMNLHVTHAYMRLHQMEKARVQLTKTKRKTFSTLFHFLKGRLALYFDELNEAINSFRTSLQLDPEQYFIWSYLSLAHLYSEDVKKAYHFSSIGMELAPNDRFIRNNHAAILLEMNEITEARKMYDQLVSEEPDDSLPYYRLGEIYIKFEKYEIAAEYFQKCLECDPLIEDAYMKLALIASYTDNQPEEIEYLLKLFDVAPLEVNIEYLVSLIDEERLQQLLIKLQSLKGMVNEIWRIDAEAYVYGALGDFNLEWDRLQEALRLEPDFSELLHHQAKVYIKIKKWSKARSLIEVLLNKYPENEDIYQTLIQFTSAANKWSRLAPFLSKLDGEKSDVSSRFLLTAEAGQQFISEMSLVDEEEGNVFSRFVRKLKNRTKQINLFGSIIELYEIAIKLNKNNLSAHSHFAKFYENFDLVEDSVKILQKALKIQWDDRIAYQLGRNYLELNDHPAALFLFERLFNENPEDSHIQYMVAFTLGEMGETGESANKLLRIIEENPYEDHVHFYLGNLLNSQGRHVEARNILEKGKEYHPFDANLLNELEQTYSYLENSKVLN